MLQYVMTLIRHYHQMTCKRKGIYNLLGMKSNLFWKESNGLAEENDMDQKFGLHVYHDSESAWKSHI